MTIDMPDIKHSPEQTPRVEGGESADTFDDLLRAEALRESDPGGAIATLEKAIANVDSLIETGETDPSDALVTIGILGYTLAEVHRVVAASNKDPQVIARHYHAARTVHDRLPTLNDGTMLSIIIPGPTPADEKLLIINALTYLVSRSSGMANLHWATTIPWKNVATRGHPLVAARRSLETAQEALAAGTSREEIPYELPPLPDPNDDAAVQAYHEKIAYIRLQLRHLRRSCDPDLLKGLVVSNDLLTRDLAQQGIPPKRLCLLSRFIKPHPIDFRVFGPKASELFEIT